MSSRPKFETKTIILRDTAIRDRLKSFIDHLPIDHDKPIEAVFREQVKARGLDANAYYWMRFTEIADQAWFNGKQYSKEVWHEYARQNLMPDTITTKDGTVRSKWEDSPDGKPVVISTTLLDKSSFAEYVTAIEAFGAGLGVRFSERNNGY